MDFDLLIPTGSNELMLAKQAKELGWEKVIFLYEAKSRKELNRYAATLKKSKVPVDFEVGLLVTSRKDLKKVRSFKDTFVAVISDSSEQFNRRAVETGGVDYVFNFASSTGRDHTHYRRGGVNQVLAKLAKENSIGYGLSFSRYLSLEQRRRTALLGRWMFNAKIFRKYKVPTRVFSLASNKWDVRSPDSLSTVERII